MDGPFSSLSSQDGCHPRPIQGRDCGPLDQKSPRGREKSLTGTIEVSSKVGKDLVTSALEREDKRYKRELEGKDKPMDQEVVQHLIAIYGNLVAAEEALRELFTRVEGLQTRRGQ